jgi:hypothetical protein
MAATLAANRFVYFGRFCWGRNAQTASEVHTLPARISFRHGETANSIADGRFAPDMSNVQGQGNTNAQNGNGYADFAGDVLEGRV